MRKLFSLICVITLICVLILPSLSLNSNIKAEVSDLFVEIPKDSWSRAPVKTVYLPITFGNLNAESDISVISIEIFDKDKNSIMEEKVDRLLKKVYAFAKSSDEVRKSLGIDTPTAEDLDNAKKLFIEIDKTKDKIKKNILVEEAWQKLKYKPSDKNPDTYTESEQKLSNLLYTKWIEIDLTKIKKDVEEEDYAPLMVRVNYEIDNTSCQTEEQTYLFYLNSLPTRTGWYPGDGHIHTTWSDGDSTVRQRRDQANSFGYKWVIITDHAGDSSHTSQARLEVSEWLAYQTDCNNAQNVYPYTTVCPGEELATVEGFSLPPNSGHLLCYANSSYASSYGTCQDLINRANSAGGFGIIAHPYNPAFLWGDWNASGFRGLEIISNQSNYSSSAVSKWDTLLTNNLQGIISGSYPKIIGMANSDVHNSTYMWGLNMNYIYTGSSSPPGTNRSTVYNNLKAGRVSASSDGSLAVFSLNDYAPGSVVNVNPGTNNISITVNAECARGDYYSQGGTIRIIKNGTAVLTDSFSGLSITRSYTLTATADCYYRVEVTFNGIVGDHVEYSYCFVNPVYVNLP
jgi:hypothetical protein